MEEKPASCRIFIDNGCTMRPLISQDSQKRRAWKKFCIAQEQVNLVLSGANQGFTVTSLMVSAYFRSLHRFRRTPSVLYRQLLSKSSCFFMILTDPFATCKSLASSMDSRNKVSHSSFVAIKVRVQSHLRVSTNPSARILALGIQLEDLLCASNISARMDGLVVCKRTWILTWQVKKSCTTDVAI